MTLKDSPPRIIAVLAAMTLADPASPEDLDSPALAITRRVPDLAPTVAIEMLHNLNALGLTDMPFIEGMLRPEATADLSKWITDGLQNKTRRCQQ